MPGRVDADLLLLAPIPAGAAQEAFRAGAGHFGDLVFALPDGETGPRSTWVGYERDTLVRPSPAPGPGSTTRSPPTSSSPPYARPG